MLLAECRDCNERANTKFTGSVNDPVERLVRPHGAVAFNELNKKKDITDATIKK